MISRIFNFQSREANVVGRRTHRSNRTVIPLKSLRTFWRSFRLRNDFAWAISRFFKSVLIRTLDFQVILPLGGRRERAKEGNMIFLLCNEKLLLFCSYASSSSGPGDCGKPQDASACRGSLDSATFLTCISTGDTPDAQPKVASANIGDTMRGRAKNNLAPPNTISTTAQAQGVGQLVGQQTAAVGRRRDSLRSS